MRDQPGEQRHEPGHGDPRDAATDSRVYRREIDCAPDGRTSAAPRGADERRAGERWPIRTDPTD